MRVGITDLPSLDLSHPLVSWLLRSFASAPTHPRGPLAAFKDPGAVVRAVAVLLLVSLAWGRAL